MSNPKHGIVRKDFDVRNGSELHVQAQLINPAYQLKSGVVVAELKCDIKPPTPWHEAGLPVFGYCCLTFEWWQRPGESTGTWCFGVSERTGICQGFPIRFFSKLAATKEWTEVVDEAVRMLDEVFAADAIQRAKARGEKDE